MSASNFTTTRIPRPLRRRAAFTLVELVVIIVITGLASAQTPDPMQVILNPPRVEDMIVRRVFADGQQRFLQICYDKTNFLVKIATKMEALTAKKITVGVNIVGCVDNSIWVCHESTTKNDIWVADLTTKQTTNSSIFEHEQATRSLANYVSRMGRCLLSFGIEMPLQPRFSTNEGEFVFRDGTFDVTCSVAFGQERPNGAFPFTAKSRMQDIEATNRPSQYYETRGEFAPDTRLLRWFELLEIGPDGGKKSLGRAEVLEAKMRNTPVPKKRFSVSENVSGFRGIVVRDNEAVAYLSPLEMRGTGRGIILGERIVSTNLIRGSIVALIAVVSVVFAFAIIKTKRQNN